MPHEDQSLIKSLIKFSKQLDDVLEFARGDQILKTYAKWADKQGPALKGMLKEHINPMMDTPEFKGILQRNPRKAGMPKKVVDQIRQTQATAIRQDKKSGILNKKFKNIDELIKARLGEFSSKIDDIINFDYNDDDEYQKKRSGISATVGKAAIGTGVVGGGLYGLGKMAPISAGGLGEGLADTTKSAVGAASTFGKGVARGAKVGVGYGKGALASILAKLKGLRA